MRKAYIGLVLAFLYIPIIVLIALSFNSSRYYVSFDGWTLQWYKKLFTNETIRSALLSTTYIAVMSALISTMLGTLGAIGLRKLPLRRIFESIADIPLLNADIVTGVSLMLLFVRFTQLNTMTVLMAHITLEIPYVMLNVTPVLNNWDEDLYHAALDLGADHSYAFKRVVLPEILPGVLSGFLMAVTMSIDDFSITYFTKGPGVNTLSTMIYTQMKRGINPTIYALSTLMFLVIFVLLMLNTYREDTNRL